MKNGFGQNIPGYHTKRLLHLLSNGCLVINLIVFAILLSDIRAWTFGFAAVFAAYTIVFLFDVRKHEWEWWSIIFGIVVSAAVSIGYILLFDLYFCFVLIGAEIVISSAIFCILLLKHKI